MRLALVANELLPLPPFRGGATHIYADALAHHLGQWFSVTVFSVQDEFLPSQSEAGRVRYIRLPQGSYLPMLTERFRLDPFDCTVVFNRPPWVPLLKALQPDSRVILSLHNEWLAPTSISGRRGRQVVAAADAIVTVSRYLAERSQSRFPSAATKTRVIYAGADLRRFSPGWWPKQGRMRRLLRNSCNLGEAPVLLFAGRLVPNKGLDVLLSAMDHLGRSHPKAILLVVGSPIYEQGRFQAYVDALRQQAESLGSRTLFTGFVPPAKIHRYYQAADLLVCPSQWQEPLARVVYEAMASGLPIVASARGGLPEMVRHKRNGLLVEAYREPAAYAEAVSYLLDHPAEARAMGRYNREFAEEGHGWEHVALRWRVLIEEVLKE